MCLHVNLEKILAYPKVAPLSIDPVVCLAPSFERACITWAFLPTGRALVLHADGAADALAHRHHSRARSARRRSSPPFISPHKISFMEGMRAAPFVRLPDRGPQVARGLHLVAVRPPIPPHPPTFPTHVRSVRPSVPTTLSSAYPQNVSLLVAGVPRRSSTSPLSASASSPTPTRCVKSGSNTFCHRHCCCLRSPGILRV